MFMIILTFRLTAAGKRPRYASFKLPSVTSFVRKTLGENLCPINTKENH